jgi:hypothetical protein
MIKVVPFIQTNCSEKFKEFLSTPFSINMLYPVLNENSAKIIFSEWKCKNMLNWYRFINDNKIILEFYSNIYKLKKVDDNITYQMNLPPTINDFINDMYRYDVQLYWSDYVEKIFEPKDYINKDEIYNYYANLLNKIGKSQELS